MKQVLKQVALFKKGDAILQVFVFVISGLACCFDQHGLVYYMLIMATCQVLSCLCWMLFFTNDTPRFAAGTLIRRIFLAVLLIAAATLCTATGAFFYLAMIMLFLGPILGTLYFIITLREIHFYNTARKPYYLL